MTTKRFQNMLDRIVSFSQDDHDDGVSTILVGMDDGVSHSLKLEMYGLTDRDGKHMQGVVDCVYTLFDEVLDKSNADDPSVKYRIYSMFSKQIDGPDLIKMYGGDEEDVAVEAHPSGYAPTMRVDPSNDRLVEAFNTIAGQATRGVVSEQYPDAVEYVYEHYKIYPVANSADNIYMAMSMYYIGEQGCVEAALGILENMQNPAARALIKRCKSNDLDKVVVMPSKYLDNNNEKLLRFANEVSDIFESGLDNVDRDKLVRFETIIAPYVAVHMSEDNDQWPTAYDAYVAAWMMQSVGHSMFYDDARRYISFGQRIANKANRIHDTRHFNSATAGIYVSPINEVDA